MKITLEDLTKGDVVKVTYKDVNNSLMSIAIVKGIPTNRLTVEFRDLAAITYDELDSDWTAEDGDVEIHEILFNYQPKSAEEILFEKFPEYAL